MSRYSLASLILFFLFLLTAKTFTYEQSLQEGYMDLVSYRFIVDHGFDSIEGTKYVSHHLERWPFHMLTRFIVSTTEADFWFVYQILTLVLLALTFFSIKSLKCDDYNKIAAFALVLFNPYGFRLFYTVPGMISDTALYVGFVVITCGLFNKSQKQIILGILLAALGRQTSLLVFPLFFALWGLKELKLKDAFLYTFFLFASFLALKLSTASFYNPQTTPLIKQAFGLFWWVLTDLNLKGFSSFFGRYLILLLTLSPLLLLVKKIDKKSLLFLATFFFVHSQPIAFGPIVTNNNIGRLCSLSIPFLIALLVIQKIKLKELNYYLLPLVLFSFHHKFSFVYYMPERKLLFGLIVFSTLLLVLYLKSKMAGKNIYERRGVVA